jgi:hypothetical protein
VELLLELELLPFDEPELDELELDEESEPDEDEDDDVEGVEDESDEEEPADSLVLADPLDELPAALFAASRLSLR